MLNTTPNPPRQSYDLLCASPVLDKIRERIRQGCLAPYLESYEQRLKAEGYALFTGRLWLRLLADFGDWLRQRGVPARMLDSSVVDKYLRYRHGKRRPRHDDLTALRWLLKVIHPKEPTTATGPVPVRQFIQYLERQRGLAAATISDYGAVVGKFLAAWYVSESRGFRSLQPNDIIGFVRREASRVSPVRAKHVVTALRSFLRFLLQRGAIDTDLASCVPAVAAWSLSALPKFISADQVQMVIDSCDRTRPLGMRDRAVLLLLARLGLRGADR